MCKLKKFEENCFKSEETRPHVHKEFIKWQHILRITLSAIPKKLLYFGKTRFDFGSAVCVRLRRRNCTL